MNDVIDDVHIKFYSKLETDKIERHCNFGAVVIIQKGL